MIKLIKPFSLLLIILLSMSSAFAADVVIYLTRHGKTMFNTVHRAQGWADTPLTAPGVEVAQQLGRGLHDIDFVATYSSDLGRARQTARIVLEAKQADEVSVIEMEGLRETCFGIFEGDTDDNMWGAAAKVLGYPVLKDLFSDWEGGKLDLSTMIDAIKKAEGTGQAEDYATVRDRMKASLLTIAQATQAQGGGNVLVVSHGMAILAVLQEITDKPYNKQVGNASVSKIIYRDGLFIVENIGDMSYVEKGKLSQ